MGVGSLPERAGPRRGPGRSLSSAGVIVCAIALLAVLFAAPALAHEGEENVPAITDIQVAIAFLAEQPGELSTSDVMDQAADKIHDAMESSDQRGVRLDLVKQADAALEAGKVAAALALLERSIGVCPGAPVVEPENAPRTPPALASPCPSVAHIRGLSSSAVGGATEPVLIALAVVLIVAGIGLARRIR